MSDNVMSYDKSIVGSDHDEISTRSDRKWSQAREELFILRDIPLCCHKLNSLNLESCLKGYLNTLKIRKKYCWPGVDKVKLEALAIFVSNHSPRIRIYDQRREVVYNEPPPGTSKYDTSKKFIYREDRT